MSILKSPVTKGILLTVAAYIVTIGAAAVTSLAIMLVLNPQGCSAYSDALLILWAAIAVVFLVSVAVVGVLAWKLMPGLVGRLIIVAVYAVAMLVSYGVIALGLMVSFNC